MDWLDWLLVEIPVLNIPVILVILLIGLWLVLRNRATPLDSPSELDRIVGQGEAVVLQFFGKL